jgi:ubiquinol-cytochrome c reductase iron-sulfur subunit
MPHAADTAERDATRRDFIHIAALTVAAGGVAVLAWPLVDQMNPAANALQPVTYDLRKVPPGQEVTIVWRGGPIFIRHRTSAEIAAAIRDDRAPMAEPQADSDRVKPGHVQWMIVVGECTYDGCVPVFGQWDFGGWFCPCCGSTFDTSGRARGGPAQGKRDLNRAKNLVVPGYEFGDDHTVRLLPT